MYIGTDESGLPCVVSIFDLLLKEMSRTFSFIPLLIAGEAGQCLDFICLNRVVIKGRRYLLNPPAL